MTSRAWIALSAMALMLLGMVGLFLHVPPSPYVPLGGDTVTPRVTNAEGIVSIHRHYEITRRASVTISRRMLSGKCPVECEVIDLPTSYLVMEPGTYSRSRDHIIPRVARPGMWTLQFTVHYEDRLGRTVSANMPPLSIEVVR